MTDHGPSMTSLLNDYKIARASRAEADELVKRLKERESELKDRIMLALDNAGLQKAGDEVTTVSKMKRAIVNITDWPAFYKHIQESGEFDLLQKRPAVRAIGDRADDGVEIPGAKLGHFYDLSFHNKAQE